MKLRSHASYNSQLSDSQVKMSDGESQVGLQTSAVGAAEATDVSDEKEPQPSEAVKAKVRAARAKLAMRRLKEEQAIRRAQMELQMKEEMLKEQMELENALLEEMLFSSESTQEEETIAEPKTGPKDEGTSTDSPSPDLHDAGAPASKDERTSTDVPSPDLCDAGAPASKGLTVDNTLQMLAETLQGGFNLPKPEIPTFAGDATDYCKFIHCFESNVESKVTDSNLRLTYLIQYCSGEAKRTIEVCNLIGVERDIRKLEKYSTTDMVGRMLLHNLS